MWKNLTRISGFIKRNWSKCIVLLVWGVKSVSKWWFLRNFEVFRAKLYWTENFRAIADCKHTLDQENIHLISSWLDLTIARTDDHNTRFLYLRDLGTSDRYATLLKLSLKNLSWTTSVLKTEHNSLSDNSGTKRFYIKYWKRPLSSMNFNWKDKSCTKWKIWTWFVPQLNKKSPW